MSEADSTGRVWLGVAGWDWPDWRTEFYPEELPEDWHVAYYAARFRCVWISHEVWSNSTPADAAHWLAETPDYFRFVLEAPSVRAAEDDSVPTILAPRLARICAADDPALVWFDADSELAALSARLREAGAEPGDVFLFSRDGNLRQIERVNNLLQLLGL